MSNTTSLETPLTQPKPPSPQNQKIRFAPKSAFTEALRKREAAFFDKTGLSRTDQPKMYRKTATLFVWCLASYGLLVFGHLPWWGMVLAAVSLGLAMTGIGFGVMHDGGHRSYSKHAWINRLMFSSVDLLGGSSYFWHWKHNHLHHAYTNIQEHDNDIDLGFYGRLSPHQPHRWFFRFQHLYLWFLYGLLAMKWHLFDDYRDLITGRIGNHKVPRPKGWDLLQFFLGKALFYTFAFALPLYFHSFSTVLAFYLLTMFVEGVVLAVVFQLAHCVEETNFFVAPSQKERMEKDWFQHQIETTANFAPKSRILTWYCGGLNFQVEHHLFPKVSHIHYPELSKMVEETCKEFGVMYHIHPTFWGAIRSHYRWLRQMGRPQTAEEKTLPPTILATPKLAPLTAPTPKLTTIKAQTP